MSYISREMINLLRCRIASFVLLLILSAVGFWMWRCYRGWGQYWVKDYISGIVYVMVLSVAMFTILPSIKNVVRMPLIAFVLTCILEFLQLYKPPILQAFRATLIGQALIGTTFVWLQFPFYIAGAIGSYFLPKFLFSVGKPHYQC